jgi:hypothetical protein
MDPTNSVTITMSADTVSALEASGYSLYGFLAVQASDQGAMPLVWSATQSYSETTVVQWSPVFQAYTAAYEGPVQNGQQIVAGFSADIAPGQVLRVQDSSGSGTVATDGTPGVVSIVNATTDAFYCGIAEAQPPSGAGAYPLVCVLPLHGNGAQVVTPLSHILLLFATVSMTPGQVVSTAPGPGVLLDFTGVTGRAVSFDIDQGWSWGQATWGQAVPALSSIVPLLVGTSATLASQALRLAPGALPLARAAR